MNDFFEIEIYLKDRNIYIYPTSLTSENHGYINYPCTIISYTAKPLSIGEAVIESSKRVSNGLDQKSNSNSEILNDLDEPDWNSFLKNVNVCKVVKKRNDSSGDIHIRKGIKKRNGYEYSKKHSTTSKISNLEDIGEKVVNALT